MLRHVTWLRSYHAMPGSGHLKMAWIRAKPSPDHVSATQENERKLRTMIRRRFPTNGPLWRTLSMSGGRKRLDMCPRSGETATDEPIVRPNPRMPSEAGYITGYDGHHARRTIYKNQ